MIFDLEDLIVKVVKNNFIKINMQIKKLLGNKRKYNIRAIKIC